MNKPMKWLGFALAAGVALALVGCDRLALNKLKPGVSTEADVVRVMGAPERVWPDADGGHALEYNRQPMGTTNYMLAIAPDGRLRAIHQVLTPAVFARVRPGMTAAEVRQMLGRPAREVSYVLKHQTVWTWRYQAQPGATGATGAFNVTFDTGQRVLEAATGPDPEGPDMVGGG